MDSRQIYIALKMIPVRTKGVFPADQIPLVWTHPTAIVANTDDHTKSGSHWVAFYVNDAGHGVYFDSFGQPVMIPHHLRTLRRNTISYGRNHTQLQDTGSSVCGQYCIMFLYYMSRGFSLSKFTGMFTKNLVKNDRIVTSFYEKLMKSRSNRSKAENCSSLMDCIQHCLPRKYQ